MNMECTHGNREIWEQDGEVYDACQDCGKTQSRSIDAIKNSLPECRMLAKKYRAERVQDRPYVAGGVVVIYDQVVAGWMSEIRDPYKWSAGCIALDVDGNGWISRGGNYQDGADLWEAL